jgi:hypothetical protein
LIKNKSAKAIGTFVSIFDVCKGGLVYRFHFADFFATIGISQTSLVMRSSTIKIGIVKIERLHNVLAFCFVGYR